MSNYIVHWGLRFCMSCYLTILQFLTIICPTPPPQETPGTDFNILLTGTFYSSNWITSHINPLLLAKRISIIYLVTVFPVPETDKLKVISPPKWLIKTTGSVSARLLTFLWVGLREKPQLVGGFHLLLNGLVALPLARLIRARSLYICGGGPREILGGGYTTENRIFKALKTADSVIEKQLLKVVDNFDLVITRGKKAIRFFSEKDVNTSFYVVPGGIDAKRFSPSSDPPTIDLIITGRISTVKRIDIFLNVVKQVSDKLPNVRAIIVGDGSLRLSLEKMAQDLGITNNIKFVGHQDQIEKWLQRAKLFVLTSDSEGLSLSMIEAMLCGLSPIVSDVGDLGELVINGENGYLIENQSPKRFCERIIELLTNPHRLGEFSKSSRRSALRCDAHNIGMIWDEILTSFD